MAEPRLVEEKVLCRGRRFSFGQRTIMYRGKRIIRDVLFHPGAVVILPLLSDENVVMLRQYRPGPLEWVYELPAGTIEEGEDPYETARRELVEETGYEPKRLRLVFKAYPSPGVSTETMYMFIAEELVKRKPEPEESEILETIVVPFAKALEMVKSGEIVDGKTVMLLLYYACFEKRMCS